MLVISPVNYLEGSKLQWKSNYVYLVANRRCPTSVNMYGNQSLGTGDILHGLS